MAIALKRRRVATVLMESAKGTFNAPTASTDAIPLIQEADFTIEPISVERPTLRLSLTKFPAIYPGQAKVTVTLLMELHGLPANPQTNYATPVWGDLMRACAFKEYSNSTSEAPHIYDTFTSYNGSDAAPMRNGEIVTAGYATSGGPIVGTCIGDTFFDDDMMVVDENSGTAGVGAITLTGTDSAQATDAGTIVRSTETMVAWQQRSDVNNMETVSMELYLDGKRLRVKGAMGNFEAILEQGDSIKGRFTMTGIQSAYVDVSMPTNANETHNVPPTFLGSDFRVSYWTGSTTRVYGKDQSTLLGAVTSVSVDAGNNVILRPNALDDAGFSFAIVTERDGTGKFNPDEVLSTGDNFDFITQFVNGVPMRLRAFIGSAEGDSGFGGTTAWDGNSFDIIAPGIVFNGMADTERDGINVWDASFKLTGGDYDATATGELPGNDNEFTLIYR